MDAFLCFQPGFRKEEENGKTQVISIKKASLPLADLGLGHSCE
jgi:hypothetical protein